jgi:3-methyl-2-oxobutanoate hydroxymethyltransferase
MAVERITIPQIQRMKDEGKKLVVMTAYDYELARIVDHAGPEMILVGDSGGRHCLGYEDFASVTMEDMILMTRSARRGAKRALVIGDMPFMSYQVSVEDAVRNAGRLMKEALADAVKLEGGEDFAPHVRAIVKAGIPVMAHMGLTPQTAMAVGGYLNQDAGPMEEQIRRDAFALQEAGAFSIVFTRVPPPIAAALTKELRVPTLGGGGSGDDCDGQVCVMHGVFGLTVDHLDAQSNYGPLARPVFEAASAFIADVRAGKPVRSRREQAPAQG